MGRTYRTRRKRKSSAATSNQYPSGNPVHINLCKWMYRNNWTNDTKLRLKEFSDTGRGIATKNISFVQHDTLLNIPYKLMISFNTLENASDFVEMFDERVENIFTIQDLLALYLALERHKGEQSFWYPYIASLPHITPKLPWMKSTTIQLPRDIKAKTDEQRSNFLTAWSKITQSIRRGDDWTCNCCKNNWDRVLTVDLFRWCYVMVNTRAVYINPSLVLRQSIASTKLRCLLSDDPSMALCPYLDMFNHSTRAGTEASLVEEGNGSLAFRLVTLTPCRKHRQVFISYGAHDNDKLMCEYGFFISGNEVDCVRFTLEDIMQLQGNDCTKLQYKYVKSLDASDNIKELLSVLPRQVSYGLKQILFVFIRPDVGVNVWNSVSFSERYTDNDLRDIYNFVQSLLNARLRLLKEELDNLICLQKYAVIRAFMRYKVQFCQLCLDSFGN